MHLLRTLKPLNINTTDLISISEIVFNKSVDYYSIFVLNKLINIWSFYLFDGSKIEPNIILPIFTENKITVYFHIIKFHIIDLLCALPKHSIGWHQQQSFEGKQKADKYYI